jgi:hypothetical protein
MLNKVSSLARALAIILAVVAGFVAMGEMNTALILVVLGVISGITMARDDIMRIGVTVLVLPMVAAALGNIPALGEQLGAIANNVALAGAGALAAGIALSLFNRVKEDLTGLTAKA